jgi:hypothetical protein
MAVIYRCRRGEHTDATLTPEELGAIAARHRDATPGPWGWSDWADSEAVGRVVARASGRGGRRGP